MLAVSAFLKVEAASVFSSAQWIGATADVNSELADRSIVLTNAILCDKDIEKAVLNICGLGSYELYVNGNAANDNILAPAWSDYRKTVFYNTFDITPLLRKGTNDFHVLLGNGFYYERGLRYHKLKSSFGPLTMLFALEVTYKSGGKQQLISDGGWKWYESPVTYNSLYGGEDYDGRMPLICSLSQKAAKGTVMHDAVVQQAPKGVLRPQLSEPVKIMERFGIKERHAIADNDLAKASKDQKHEVQKGAFVLDMGQNLAGFPEITVKGKAGQKVVMYVSETLTPEGACNQKQSGRPHYYIYTIKGNDANGKTMGGYETWHPRFSYYGYRYIQIEGAVMEGDPNPEGKPVVKDVKSCFIYNSARKTGSFECSNERINATYRIIDRAIRSNWQNVWTDCPHREKLGWLEQDWLNGEGLVYNYNCKAMIEQTMRVIADAQHPDGSLPEIAPEYLTFEGSWAPPFQESPEWGGAVVALPFLYLKHYGSDQLIRDYYPVMKCYVDYLATQDSCLILKQGLGDWYDYGPWRAGFGKNTPMPLVSTAHYYKWTLLTAQAAKMLRNEYDAAQLNAHALRIKEAFNKEFYNAQTHQYGTGSQCANAIALDMQLAPEADREAILQNLIADIHAHGDRLTTGDVGNRYLFKVLIENGQHELLYTMLNHDDVPGYGYQIQKGMTTLTEQWNPDMGASMNHFMLAHINNHLIPSLAGIKINGDKVTIDPQPVGDIEWVKASAETGKGTVTVEWHRQPDGKLKVDYTAPPGVLCLSDNAMAQATYSNNYERSLTEVMSSVEKQFGVTIKYNVDTVGKRLPYADFRIRPYSIEETLDNICKYFDFNWWDQGKGVYKIKPYEYMRRHTSDGEKMLAWLSSKYADKAQWEARRDSLRKEVRQRLEIDAYLDSCVKNPKVILSKVRKFDGYSVQNICIETLPGEHVFGSIYTPLSKGKHALIICPNGHFGDGRYRKDQQWRLGTLARMGAICVDFDLYGWGESQNEHPTFVDDNGVKHDGHRTDRAHVVQAMNGLVLLNWMLANRSKQIDTSRIGVNGGSGGGTLTTLLTALDDRFTAAAPTVSLASHFDGGCPCESGKPIHLSAGGTCNAEILAMFAPKPVQVVSDGGDWTASVPELEYPYLQRIWGFYGAKDAVSNVHLPKERHDFRDNKRKANYEFFINVFNLDRSMLDESKVTVEPYDALKTNLK